jgi:hypothetical protein
MLLLGPPDFLHEAPNRFACAAFSKESRMKLANANKLDRKSGSVSQRLNSLLFILYKYKQYCL